MNKSPILDIENAMTTALYQLNILDTEAEKEFDDICRLAMLICQAPKAIIGFKDNDRFWFKSRIGTSQHFKEIPNGRILCEHLETSNNVAIIEDTLMHEAFRQNSDITEEDIRFIASAPLTHSSGASLGYLCVFDNTPRGLTDVQADALSMLASQVVALLQLRVKLLTNLENDYAASEAQMKTIFQNAIDAVIITNDKGVILQWNPKAEEIFGWTEAEVAGLDFNEICLPGRYRENHFSLLMNAPHFSENELNKTIEVQATRKNNTTFDIALGISPTIIKERTYYIYFISDITGRKLATRELDHQKEFYENILNNIPTDIAVFDANHKYLFVNPSAIKNEELRRYIIGKDDFEYATYRNRDPRIAQLRRNKFLEAKELAKEIRWEDSLVGPDGTVITHLRRMFPVHNTEGTLTMVIGFGMDITERKEMEEKQATLLKQLSVQNTQLADFCNIVSHNLRAPMVNMSLLVSFIESCEELAEQKLLISKLNPVLDNLSTTFNELVESIQIKQDLEIVSEKVKLEDYLNRTLEGLETEISNSGAVFHVSFEEAPELYYPAKYINSIFQNLISNALKYQSPLRKPEIIIKVKKTNRTVVLSVCDNGLGVDLVRHRDSFFKIGKVFHHHPHAKGFGLFMTKTHIESMGGRIWVESEPDKGATFYVEFINQSI